MTGEADLREQSPRLRDGVACAASVLAAILCSRPFVEMGLIDDFSYVRSALIFARTGHFVFNGWATAMLGAQIVWAAPFIKLFGYSFSAARISTIVTAMLTVLLTHSIMRRAGLNRWPAIFGTLALGLCPLFIAMSVTFMTDISGLFAIVVGIYCCMRALECTDFSRILMWLVFADIAGLLGGTTRQIAWLVALVMVPSAAYIIRKHHGVLIAAVILWIVSVALIIVSMVWFKHQPLSVPEPLLKGAVRLRTLRELAGTMLAALLCLCLVIMPGLTVGLQRLRTLRARHWLLLLVCTTAATCVCWFITFHWSEKGLMPWTGDILDKLGLFDYPNAWRLGTSPALLNPTGRAIGSYIVLFTVGAFFLAILRAPSESPQHSQIGLSVHTLLLLLGPFAGAYTLLLIPRGLWAQVLDRYLLPLIPIALIFVLKIYQENFSPRLPTISWLTLVIFAVFGVMGTHDWVADHRARLTAVYMLESAGISPASIEAGYEFDGTTQIDLRGAVFDPRVTYPSSIDVSPYHPAGLPSECSYLLNEHTPAVHPEFFLAFKPVPCLVLSRYGAVPYGTWLPPVHRSILILQRGE